MGFGEKIRIKSKGDYLKNADGKPIEIPKGFFWYKAPRINEFLKSQLKKEIRAGIEASKKAEEEKKSVPAPEKKTEAVKESVKSAEKETVEAPAFSEMTQSDEDYKEAVRETAQNTDSKDWEKSWQGDKKAEQKIDAFSEMTEDDEDYREAIRGTAENADKEEWTESWQKKGEKTEDKSKKESKEEPKEKKEENEEKDETKYRVIDLGEEKDNGVNLLDELVALRDEYVGDSFTKKEALQFLKKMGGDAAKKFEFFIGEGRVADEKEARKIEAEQKFKKEKSKKETKEEPKKVKLPEWLKKAQESLEKGKTPKSTKELKKFLKQSKFTDKQIKTMGDEAWKVAIGIAEKRRKSE
jgi:hypothetical protein